MNTISRTRIFVAPETQDTAKLEAGLAAVEAALANLQSSVDGLSDGTFGYKDGPFLYEPPEYPAEPEDPIVIARAAPNLAPTEVGGSAVFRQPITITQYNRTTIRFTLSSKAQGVVIRATAKVATARGFIEVQGNGARGTVADATTDQNGEATFTVTGLKVGAVDLDAAVTGQTYTANTTVMFDVM